MRATARVTDGAIDYTNLADIKFKSCKFCLPAVGSVAGNLGAMTELFRFEVIKAMLGAGVLASEIADNLVSWKNSEIAW